MTEFYWAKVSSDEVFVQASLVERKTASSGRSKLVLARLDDGARLEAFEDDAYACRDPSQEGATEPDNAGASPYDVDDLVKLAEVNPATIFFALRVRFEREEIYTSMGIVLVALNPFKHLAATFNESVLSSYVEAARLEAVEDTPPHVWQTAARAYAAMATGGPQSICISGESGAMHCTWQCSLTAPRPSESPSRRMAAASGSPGSTVAEPTMRGSSVVSSAMNRFMSRAMPGLWL